MRPCRFLASLILSGLLFVAAPSRADGQDTTWSPPRPGGVRIGLAATSGYASLQRSTTSPTDVGGLTLGAELRVYPSSPHGLVLGFTQAEGIFGPHVSIVDADYSFMLLGSRDLSGGTAALYVDLGPSIGSVSHAGFPTSSHVVLGGRASLTFDVQLWNFTLGAQLAYRGGAPLSGTPDAWEGAATGILRLGFVFDLKGR